MELHTPKVNEGFTEITFDSPRTHIKKINTIEFSDLLFFCEANNYCWNFAHDILWRHDGRGIQTGMIYKYEFEGEEAECYEPRCAEIMRRFFKYYRITEVYLLPKC